MHFHVTGMSTQFYSADTKDTLHCLKRPSCEEDTVGTKVPTLSLSFFLTVIAHKVALHQAERRDHLKTWYCSGEVRTHLANWKIFLFFFTARGRANYQWIIHISQECSRKQLCVIGGWVKCSSWVGRCFCAENLRPQHNHIRGVIKTGMYKTIMWFSGMTDPFNCLS